MERVCYEHKSIEFKIVTHSRIRKVASNSCYSSVVCIITLGLNEYVYVELCLNMSMTVAPPKAKIIPTCKSGIW